MFKGEPRPAARATAKTLYANAHIKLAVTCRIVLVDISSKVSTSRIWDCSIRTLPPDDRHLLPWAIITPTSAAARLGASFMPSPICNDARQHLSHITTLISTHERLTIRTLWPFCCSTLTWFSFAAGVADEAKTSIPNCWEIRRASLGLSPVSIVTLSDLAFNAETVASASGLSASYISLISLWSTMWPLPGGTHLQDKRSCEKAINAGKDDRAFFSGIPGNLLNSAYVVVQHKLEAANKHGSPVLVPAVHRASDTMGSALF